MEDRTHLSHTGLTDETARTRRACNFVRQLAADLDMPTTTTCSALAIWHAYVAERDRPGGSGLDSEGKQLGAASSAREREKSPLEWYKVECAAAILLACKAGEVARKVRDVVNVAHLRGSASAQPIQVSAEFWDLRDAVVAAEQDILRSLGFGVRPELPFAYLLNYLRALAASPALSAVAHSLLVESFDVNLAARHAPHAIAAGCIHAAALVTDTALDPPAWYDVVDVSREELCTVAGELVSLLERIGERLPARPPPAGSAAAEAAAAEDERRARDLRLWLRAK